MNNKFKAIIFDCDGVIIDSEYLFLENTINFLKKRNIHQNISDVTKYIGLPLDTIIKMIIAEYELKDSVEFVEQYFQSEDVVYNHPEKLKILNNLNMFLEWAKNNNIVCAIASSSPKDYVERVVTILGIKKYFKTIVTIEDVKYGKPFPDVYIEACKRLNIKFDEAVAIEDSPVGIKAAKTAGLYTIGYKGARVKQDTSASNISVYDFQEIINKLEGK